jgi:hypothetical protein
MLIHPVFVRPLAWRRVAITRRCPDCEAIDVVTASALTARLWRAREALIHRDLSAVCHER